jgi:hypothetical protein
MSNAECPAFGRVQLAARYGAAGECLV